MSEPSDTTEPQVLTEHEQRVAAAVGAGATNKAVARALTISIKTVEFHLSNIYRKLDMSSRSELANLVGRSPSLLSGQRTGILGNLPHDRTPLVGRSDELARLSALVEERALITVTGFGGVGKTRLVVAAAHLAQGRFDDGAWIVELGMLTSGRDVPAACGIALGLRQRSAFATVGELVDALGTQRRLIVLDNCEHLLDATTLAATAIVSRCPNIVVMATSRERLDAPEEFVFALAPLRVDGEERPSAAARLFIERACSVVDGFVPSDSDLDVIDDICRRLDGLPLAIELAAARLVGLSVGELDEQLEEGLRLLTRRRAIVGRHQSLLAAIEWSYDLLSDDQREVLEAISCFAGDFDLVSAVAVTGPLTPDLVAESIATLIEKSMLSTTIGPTGRRFRLLETIRVFSADRLRVRGCEATVRRRHLDRFVALINDAKQGLRGDEELHWHLIMTNEWHNLRVALDTACALDAGAEACAIVDGAFWWAMTRLRAELGEWAERVLTLPSVSVLPTKVVLLSAVAYFANMRGDHTRALAAYADARTEEQRSGLWPEPWVCVVAPFVADLNDMLAVNEETQQRARTCDNLFWEVVGILQEGAVRSFIMNSGAADKVQLDGHLKQIRRGSELAERLGNPNGIAYAARNLGSALSAREPDVAERLLERSLTTAGPLGLELLAGQARTLLAQLYLRTGRSIEALSVLAAALRAHIRTGALSDICYDLAMTIVELARLGELSLAALPIDLLHDLGPYVYELFALHQLSLELRNGLTLTEYQRIVARGLQLGLVESSREIAFAIEAMLNNGQIPQSNGHSF